MVALSEMDREMPAAKLAEAITKQCSESKLPPQELNTVLLHSHEALSNLPTPQALDVLFSCINIQLLTSSNVRESFVHFLACVRATTAVIRAKA